MDADGVVHVDAGKHVGGGIRPMDKGHQSAEHIFIRVHHGPQVRAVAEKCAYYQADGHPGKQEGAQLVIILPAGKQKVKNSCSHVQKPQQVGDDEILAEGN